MASSAPVLEFPPPVPADVLAAHLYTPSRAEQLIVDVHDLRKVFVKRRSAPDASMWQRLALRAQRTDERVAVAGVSFGIAEGEIFGLLGPNGAGKTTTIRMLSTLLQPSAGRATINGYDLASQPDMVRRNLGAVLTGERSIYWKLSARENSRILRGAVSPAASYRPSARGRAA